MNRSGPVHARLDYNRAMFPTRIAALVVLALLTQPAFAAPGSGVAPETRPARPWAEGLTLDEAVAKVEKKYGARAVRAEEHTEDGRRVYRIRLLSEDGRVFDVSVDAATGQVE